MCQVEGVLFPTFYVEDARTLIFRENQSFCLRQERGALGDRQREGSTECEEEAVFVQCVCICVYVCRGPGGDDLGYWGNSGIF